MAFKKPWSREIWKMIAILALAAALLLGAVGVYAVFAFKSNLDVIIDGAPICLKGARDYDSIAAAQAVGRLDLVSFILTIGGILLAMFGLLGFWVIRREAMEEARDAALREVRTFLTRLEPDLKTNGSTKRESRATVTGDGTALAPAALNPSEVDTSGAVVETPGGSNADA